MTTANRGEERPETRAFLDQEVRFHDVGAATLAHRTFGSGPPLLMIHGWPLWGFTFRRLVPRLAAHRSCCVVDLPGGGDTLWTAQNDFSFHGHARNLARFVDLLGWSSFDILAHDTGATTARFLAWLLGPRVRKMVLIDTEIPGHRPPWVPLLTRLVSLPGAAPALRRLLRSTAFVESKLGFGGCFADRRLLRGEFADHIIAPLIRSRRRMQGQIEYAKGIDWDALDELASIHAKLKSPVLLVWGSDDPFFPVDRAREMVPQFPDCRGLRVVQGGRLLTHEEFPDTVGDYVLEFLA